MCPPMSQHPFLSGVRDKPPGEQEADGQEPARPGAPFPPLLPSPNITCVPAQQGQKPISERAQLCLYNGTALGSGFPSHLRGPLPLRDLALVQGRWAVGTP